ncbi:MAG: hypothetical protein GEU80_11675 [Dehalococcoidia bacterium]|nr:hypothetical protein [Dehalococcoidia bacterium]
MQKLLRDRLDQSFSLYDELASSLDGAQLRQKLPVPSNTLGEQLWCVIGSRESWARAIELGAWDAWGCSVDAAGVRDAEVMRGALLDSGRAVRASIEQAGDDEARSRLALELLEHECQHQGQILRYLLGLRIDVPEGWKRRFAL